MSFKNYMFNPAFMQMQNQSSLISRMMGSSSKMGVMGSPQYMSKASMKAYSKIMAKQMQSYDSFSRTESASKTEDKAEYSRVAGQANRAGGTNSYTPTPKATLADVTAAFDDARTANHAKLDNAGNEIIAVNDRAGRDLMYASTRINGARYDYQSTQYASFTGTALDMLLPHPADTGRALTPSGSPAFLILHAFAPFRKISKPFGVWTTKKERE